MPSPNYYFDIAKEADICLNDNCKKPINAGDAIIFTKANVFCIKENSVIDHRFISYHANEKCFNDSGNPNFIRNNCFSHFVSFLTLRK